MLETELASDPEAKWEKAEEFFIGLLQISNVKERLTIWAFKLDFVEQKEFFKDFNKALKLAFKSIKESDTLKSLLGIILGLGNILNGGI
jgi:hypothetical protein